jgi:hypothetical protein
MRKQPNRADEYGRQPDEHWIPHHDADADSSADANAKSDAVS